jgi:peptide/nickel transport system permease protein
VAAFAKPSVALVILIIAFTSWMGIARFVRAEMLKIKNLEFIESARALGYRSFRIVWKEALPNALRSVVVSAAFGVASAIMAEATISFLNIGIPPETVTWGKMLALARSAPTAWWIALSPGILILLTVVSLNIIGDKFNEKER